MRVLFRILAFLILLLIGAAVGALAVASRLLPDPTTLRLRERSLPPSVTHLFGTDDLGRDILSRNVHQIVDAIPGGAMAVGVIAILLIASTFIVLITTPRMFSVRAPAPYDYPR